MSYLNPLRLHFAGRFQANPSTVNNDPNHFNNATFAKSDQLPGRGQENGWWNPNGDGAWRLSGCAVTAAFTAAGPAAAGDPVLGYQIADSNQQVCAKIVDLDSQQQMTSEIWGLQVRIADADSNTLLQGDFKTAAFSDIWMTRATGRGARGDMGASAMWQSVLTNLHWGDVSGSPFLTALREAAGSGKLSIKFNCDGYNMDSTSPAFTYGRVCGTIGPALPGEPDHLVLGRQFIAVDPDNQGINHFAARIDPEAACIFLDLGNALATAKAGGSAADAGALTLGVIDPLATPGNPAGIFTPLGSIAAEDYLRPDWFNRTAGVVAIPLSADQLEAVRARPLALVGADPYSTCISEAPSGVFVRADRFVYRLSPGERVEIPVYATLWGQALANAEITFVPDNGQLQSSPGLPVGTPPLWDTVANPAATTDAAGMAVLAFTAPDPGTPRAFDARPGDAIDGQVYGIRPWLAGAPPGAIVNPSNFISFLVWSGFSAPMPLTWTVVAPIFQQYANLYPVMKRFLDLSNYDAVVANARLLKLAFGLDPADPNAMPVTRDLSPAKRDAILAWLDRPLPGAVAATTRAPAAPQAEPLAEIGGKTAAMARRLAVNKTQ